MLQELTTDTKPEPAAANKPGEQRHASVRLSCTAGFGAWLDGHPGDLRGLVMIGDYAVIGASQLRNIQAKPSFSIPGFVASTASVNNSGPHVVDLRSAEVVHRAELAGLDGIHDLAFVAGLGNPLIPVLDGSVRNPEWTHFRSDWPAESAQGGAITASVNNLSSLGGLGRSRRAVTDPPSPPVTPDQLPANPPRGTP